jgi:hypothetical protein
VAPEEPLVRYVTCEDRINWKQRPPIVKEQQFHPDKKRNEVSTFRVELLTHVEVAVLGNNEVVARLKQPVALLGWGCFNAGLVKQASNDLFIDTAEDPEDPMHPRHAAIRGWPDDDDASTRKARMKSIAQIFSEKARLALSEVGKEIAAKKAVYGK